MAKAPRPGTVKTRLAPLLGHQSCAALQAALLRQAAVTSLSCAPQGCFVAVDPPDALCEVADELPAEISVFAQAGRNLGERMAAAAAHVFAEGHRPVVIIGTDVPLLRPSHIDAAFARLESGCDVIFAPALDGGYTLVGIAGEHREVFDIDASRWGGPHVLADSLAASEDAGFAVGVLGSLRDLDTPEDAAALLGCAELPTEVRHALVGSRSPLTNGTASAP